MNKEKLNNIFKEFQNHTILVIGDLMLDNYVLGKTERISPEAPVPVVEIEQEFSRLGGSGNVISNIVSLGGNVIPCGVIGEDDAGFHIMSELIKFTSLLNILYDKNRHTIQKTRIFSGNQQMLRVDRETKTSISDKYKLDIFDFINEYKNNYQAVIISDYQKGLLDCEFVQKIITFCRENNKIIFVDPKGQYEKYIGSNFITPNLKELSIATGLKINTNEEIYDAGMKLYHRLKIDGLVVTRGQDGISVIRNDGHKMITLPTRAKEVFDVSGAGDTVIATFALSYLSGLTMEESAEIANLAAGVVVGKVGTAMATPGEILRMV